MKIQMQKNENWWSTARLVFGENSPGTPAAASDVRGERPAREPRSAPATRAEAQLGRAAAVAANDTERQAAQTEADNLIQTQLEALPPSMGKFIETMKKHQSEMEGLLNEEDASKFLAAFENFVKNLPVEEKNGLEDSLKNFRAADFKEKLNIHAVADQVEQKKITVGDLVVLSFLMKPEEVDSLQITDAQKQMWKETVSLAEKCRIEAKTFAKEDVDGAFGKYSNAYEAFLDDKDEKKFLAAVTNSADKKIIEWALKKDGVTDREKQDVRDRLKEKIPADEAGVIQLAKDENLNYREVKILRTVIVDDAARTQETRDSIARAAGAGGLAATLELLVKKLTELAEKLGLEFDKFVKQLSEDQKSPKFAASPLANSEKFTVPTPYKEGDEGVTLKLDASGKDIAAVAGGKVIKAEEDTVVLEVGQTEKSLIIYKGITPKPGLKDQTVAIGAVLGKSNSDTLNFQFKGPDHKQINPTSYLRDYIKT